MAKRTPATVEAAAVLRRVLAALTLPASVEAYLRGYADGLERRKPPR